MTIKQATIYDAEIISRIHASSWKSTYKNHIPQQYLDDLQNDFWVSTFQDWIKNNKATSQILYENQQPAGCITYGDAREDAFPHWGEIFSIYFDPNFIGKGYGKQLLDIALSDLTKQGKKDIYLWVLENNLNARKFYEKNGFSCSNDRFTFDILGKPLADIRYTIHIGD